MNKKILIERERIKQIMGIINEGPGPLEGLFGDVNKISNLVRQVRDEKMITNDSIKIAQNLKTAFEELKNGQNLSDDLKTFFTSPNGKKILSDLKSEIDASGDFAAQAVFGRFEKDLESKLGTVSDITHTAPIAKDVVVNINSNNLTQQSEKILGSDISKQVDNILADTNAYSNQVTDAELTTFYNEMKKRIAEAKVKVIEAEPNLVNLDVALKQQQFDFNQKNQSYYEMMKLKEIEKINEELYQQKTSFLKNQQLIDADIKLKTSQTDTELLKQKGERWKLRKNYVKSSLTVAAVLGVTGLAYFFFTTTGTSDKVGEVAGTAILHTGGAVKKAFNTVKSGIKNNTSNGGNYAKKGDLD